MKNILDFDLIETEVECENWEQVIEACGNLLLRKGLIKREFIQTMIDVVHQYGPYMILLPQIAFFHGQPGKLVNETCLSLITLKNPIIFDDFQKEQINCAFGFAAVDSDSHVKLLQNIVQLLQNEKFTELIRNHGTKEEILAVIADMKEEDYEA